MSDDDNSEHDVKVFPIESSEVDKGLPLVDNLLHSVPDTSIDGMVRSFFERGDLILKTDIPSSESYADLRVLIVWSHDSGYFRYEKLLQTWLDSFIESKPSEGRESRKEVERMISSIRQNEGQQSVIKTRLFGRNKGGEVQ